jgi:hypothetical protein
MLLFVLGASTPGFAQAPAPKVTINGLIDFVTSAYKGMAQQSQQAGMSPNQPDLSLGNAKHGWYSRERGVFTLTGEVGRVKGVWAIELDFALETRWAPGVRTTLTYAQISEGLDRFIAPNQKDSFAILLSLEADIFKTISPASWSTAAAMERRHG